MTEVDPLFAGVLTKPDRIPAGKEFLWLPYIRNEKEPLPNNWFCVKQPSPNDLKRLWTWEQAREMENDFFTNTAPWNELEEAHLRLLKTGNLVERLKNVLDGLIYKRCAVCSELLCAMERLTWADQVRRDSGGDRR